LRAFAKVVNCKLSEREHVLIVEGVEEPVLSKDFIYKAIFFSAVKAQNIHWDTEHEESNKENYYEVLDIFKCLFNKLDEERRL